jgi:hypothetical protein
MQAIEPEAYSPSDHARCALYSADAIFVGVHARDASLAPMLQRSGSIDVSIFFLVFFEGTPGFHMVQDLRSQK